MRTRLFGSIMAFALVAPLSLFTANTAEASSNSAIRTIFWSVPYAIRVPGSTFPMSAPSKTLIIEVTCAQKTRSESIVGIRGAEWIVFKGQTRRFKTNKLLGVKPRLTYFYLKLSIEGRRTAGSVNFKR
jgi:hypothetical protein